MILSFAQRPWPSKSALAVALCLTLSLPAWSQSSSGVSAGSTGGTSSQRAGQVAEEVKEMMEDLAHANLAEIDTGRMALEKAKSPQVKSFAQQMIDEHTTALKEVQQLGQKKQLTLPTETDFQHKAIGAALRLLSGDTFDKQYIRQVGIKDHRRTVDLLQKAQRSTDADLKAHADKMLPIVQRHLSQARELERQMK